MNPKQTPKKESRNDEIDRARLWRIQLRDTNKERSTRNTDTDKPEETDEEGEERNNKRKRR